MPVGGEMIAVSEVQLIVPWLTTIAALGLITAAALETHRCQPESKRSLALDHQTNSTS
jgi:hypothetical protein